MSRPQLQDSLASCVEAVTAGRWRLGRAEQRGDGLRLPVDLGGEGETRSLVLEVRAVVEGQRSYKTIGRYALSYQGKELPAVARGLLDPVLVAIAKVLHELDFDPSAQPPPRPETVVRERGPALFPTPYQCAQLDAETPLSQADIETFRRDGHVLVRRALRRDVIVAARPPMLEALASPPEEASSKDTREDAYARAFRQITDLGHSNVTVRAFAYGRRVLRMAADLMGVESVRLFCEDWLIKEPGASITPWHQDEAVFPFEAEQSITCWIPLQDVRDGDGLMRFATGSHRLGLADIEDISDTSESEYDRIIERNGLTVDTQPPVFSGDVSFHHGRTIHGAFANDSDRHRVVLALHCFADGARIKPPTTPKMARLLTTALPGAEPGDLAQSDRWPRVYERDSVRTEVGEPRARERLHLRARWLPDATELRDLWIVDGRIRLEPVDGATTIAEPGGYLTAGLVECHGHISYPQDRDSPVGTPAWMNGKRAEYAATGVLLIRDMGAVGDEITDLTDWPGLPRVQAAGNMVLRYDDFPFTCTEPEALVATCIRRMEAGARWVKIFSDWSSDYRGRVNTGFRGDDALTYAPDLLTAAVAAVHERGGRVAAHCFTHTGAEASIRARVDSLEHGWGIDKTLLDRMVDAGIAWTPLVGIAVHMWRAAQREDQRDRMIWVQDAMAGMERHLPLAVERGVPLLAGTDMFPEVSLGDEVRQLCELGVEPTTAVGAASWAARAWLGESGIEEGAPADLVLFREDPRIDPTVLGSPELIVSGGERVTPSVADIRPSYVSWSQRDEA
ncbi:MAG: phytanoyl-CoA dioxygenase family protein [Myxococcota bacterium]